MLEHIDKEAHRGVFVYVGERIRLVVTYLLLLLLCYLHFVVMRLRVCTIVMGAA